MNEYLFLGKIVENVLPSKNNLKTAFTTGSMLLLTK